MFETKSISWISLLWPPPKWFLVQTCWGWQYYDSYFEKHAFFHYNIEIYQSNLNFCHSYMHYDHFFHILPSWISVNKSICCYSFSIVFNSTNFVKVLLKKSSFTHITLRNHIHTFISLYWLCIPTVVLVGNRRTSLLRKYDLEVNLVKWWYMFMNEY